MDNIDDFEEMLFGESPLIPDLVGNTSGIRSAVNPFFYSNFQNLGAVLKYATEHQEEIKTVELLKRFHKCSEGYCRCYYEYQILKKVLTQNNLCSFASGSCWMPGIELCEEGRESEMYSTLHIGKIHYNNKIYTVLGGYGYKVTDNGLIDIKNGIGSSYIDGPTFMFLPDQDLAAYVSTHFGKLVFTLLYDDGNWTWA
jgi:hypothetical protein